jgi:hypothetical protein
MPLQALRCGRAGTSHAHAIRDKGFNTEGQGISIVRSFSLLPRALARTAPWCCGSPSHGRTGAQAVGNPAARRWSSHTAAVQVRMRAVRAPDVIGNARGLYCRTDNMDARCLSACSSPRSPMVFELPVQIGLAPSPSHAHVMATARERRLRSGVHQEPSLGWAMAPTSASIGRWSPTRPIRPGVRLSSGRAGPMPRQSLSMRLVAVVVSCSTATLGYPASRCMATIARNPASAGVPPRIGSRCSGVGPLSRCAARARLSIATRAENHLSLASGLILPAHLPALG